MIVGVTGTRYDLSKEQTISIAKVLMDLPIEYNTLRHGCCTGADEQFALQGKAQGFFIIGHPANKVATKWVSTEAIEISDRLTSKKPPLVRNEDIVSNCDLLIAAPGPTKPTSISGTWYTIDYAKSKKIPIIYIWHDGTIEDEKT